MWIQLIVTVIVLIVVYSIGFIRGEYKASDRNMKAYIELKKRQGVNRNDISKEVLEIFKIRKTL